MRPNCDEGIARDPRLTIRRPRGGFGWAGVSRSAALAGGAGRTLKMRGWRRGCDWVDRSELSVAATLSTGFSCCLGLNKSSAFFRALSIFSRSTSASVLHSLGKRYSRVIINI